MIRHCLYVNLRKFVSEMTRLHLFETFSLPLLTCGLNCVFVPCTQLKKLNVGWNNVHRRIFGMNVWESVKLVQLFKAATHEPTLTADIDGRQCRSPFLTADILSLIHI